VKRFVLLLAVTVVAAAASAEAAVACNPGRSNNFYQYQDGWLNGPKYGTPCLNGSLADVLVYNAYRIDGNGAWTMLYYGTTGHFAQVGWQRLANQSYKNFVELNTADLGDVIKFPSNVPQPTAGETPEYKVDFANNFFHFFIRGTIVYTSDSTGYLGCDAAQAGEIQTLADQMPGGTSSHETFSSSEVRNANNNTWFASSLWTRYAENADTGADASTYFGNSSILPSNLQIWDKNCST
jgi:hypothetical protein